MKWCRRRVEVTLALRPRSSDELAQGQRQVCSRARRGPAFVVRSERFDGLSARGPLDPRAEAELVAPDGFRRRRA